MKIKITDEKQIKAAGSIRRWKVRYPSDVMFYDFYTG